MSQNPLLNYQEFVPYAKLKAEHIVPAVKAAIAEAQQKLEEILEQEPHQITFNSSLLALIELEQIVEKVWTPVENLLSLMGSKEIREAANEARPLIVEFFNDYTLDPRVYDLVKAFARTEEAEKLNPEKTRYLKNLLLDFKLSGAELEGVEKEEFKKLNLELAEISQKFSENATDSKYELIITEEQELLGMPQDAIQAARALADEYRAKLGAQTIPEGAVIFNLDYPSYMPFMKYAPSSNLRKQLYLNFLKQGTKEASKGFLAEDTANLDNEILIAQICKAKLRKAKLLGFKNYASLSLETKMAPSPGKVIEFLERIGSKARPLAEKEYQELVEFQKKINYKNSENNPDRVFPWDKEYLAEKLRKEKYDLDSNIVKEYFSLTNVLNGMLDLATRLFGIEFQEDKDIETWHQDVTVYKLIDQKTKKTLGVFYMDLYPRDIKRQGAWLMPLVSACTNSDGSRTVAQCALVCNLTKPTKDTPSLLPHSEVETLFHEFGHALHHMLSDVELEPLAGTNVEWDFVELPSQLMENFTWENISLSLFAKHYKSGTTIPDELLSKMLAARNFHEGLACIRQIEFGLFDLAVYTREKLEDNKSVLDIFKEIVTKYGLFPVWQGTNFPCSFSHIFAGGYAAGYYSYKWAEVLEADAFAQFKNNGVINQEIGLKYRNSILSKGDSKSPMDLFIEFVGREPDESALLTRMGL
ncbi:MAG: M3 family metallopeptidase [Candidatus Caenarcaniphilales bacterium]|jgi:Zn-dependent oligopeptidase|nr:M3 family metallopeptidase [Candidatus Caenarcaniphilales bacterium]